MLGTISKDENKGFFHVAFVIIDNGTDVNLTLFISTLGDALYRDDDYDKIIAFVLDRTKGLVNTIETVFILPRMHLLLTLGGRLYEGEC